MTENQSTLINRSVTEVLIILGLLAFIAKRCKQCVE